MKTEKELTPRAQATHGKIISAAIDCFREKGVQGASVDLIAERAGVTKPTLYAHFGSKDNLFNSVVETVKQQAGSRAWPAYRSDQPLIEQILKVFSDHIDASLAPKNRQLYRALVIELARRGDEQPSTEDRPRVIELSLILEAAQADGVLQVDDPTVTAKALLSMLKGQFFWPAILGIERTTKKERGEELSASLDALIGPMLTNKDSRRSG